MTPDEIISSINSHNARLARIILKMNIIKQKLEDMEVPKYRSAGILDQLVLQLQQANSADDLYSSLEADYSDTYLVWE